MKVIMRHFSSTENEVQLHSIAKLNERPRIVGVGEADCIPQIRPSDLKKWERMVRPWFSVSLISFSSVGRSTNGIKKYFLSGAQLLKGSCYRPTVVILNAVYVRKYWFLPSDLGSSFFHHTDFDLNVDATLFMRLLRLRRDNIDDIEEYETTLFTCFNTFLPSATKYPVEALNMLRKRNLRIGKRTTFPPHDISLTGRSIAEWSRASRENQMRILSFKGEYTKRVEEKQDWRIGNPFKFRFLKRRKINGNRWQQQQFYSLSNFHVDEWIFREKNKWPSRQQKNERCICKKLQSRFSFPSSASVSYLETSRGQFLLLSVRKIAKPETES